MDFLSKEKNDNHSTELFHETKKILFEPFNNEKTESNTNTKIFLNKKRNHEKISYENKNHILIKENLKEKEALKEKENSNRGRRKKNIEYDDNPQHSKFKEDNIIQKIKTFIFDYILDHLNKSLKLQIYKFYPLTKELNINLKKEFNEKLLERTIYDIYMNSDLNMRYISIPDSNRTLIKKIYEENIEIETINILEKRFKDILDYIREKDLENFLTNFRLREIKKDDKFIDSYMKEVKKNLFKYEFFFQAKQRRNV